MSPRHKPDSRVQTVGLHLFTAIMSLTKRYNYRWFHIKLSSQLTFISSSVGVFSSRNISPSVSSTFETHSTHKHAQHRMNLINSNSIVKKLSKLITDLEWW